MFLLKPNTIWKKQNRKVGSLYLHCDDKFQLFCLPICGKYDYYGRIEDIVKDNHTAYLEKTFGITIEELVNISTCTRDVYDKYSERYKTFFVYKDLLSNSNLSLKELLEGMNIKFDNNVAQIEKYRVVLNDEEYYVYNWESGDILDEGKYKDAMTFLNKFQECTNIWLGIKNLNTFKMTLNLSACFILKDILDKLMCNTKAVQPPIGCDLEYCNITPGIAINLGFQVKAFNEYSCIKENKEYILSFKDKTTLNGKEICYIKDFQNIVGDIFAEELELLNKHTWLDFDGFNIGIAGYVKKEAMNSDASFKELKFSYMAEIWNDFWSSSLFYINDIMKEIYQESFNLEQYNNFIWQFEEQYNIANKTIFLLEDTHHMLMPTCAGGQESNRDLTLLINKEIKSFIETNKY